MSHEAGSRGISEERAPESGERSAAGAPAVIALGPAPIESGRGADDAASGAGASATEAAAAGVAAVAAAGDSIASQVSSREAGQVAESETSPPYGPSRTVEAGAESNSEADPAAARVEGDGADGDRVDVKSGADEAEGGEEDAAADADSEDLEQDESGDGELRAAGDDADASGSDEADADAGDDDASDSDDADADADDDDDDASDSDDADADADDDDASDSDDADADDADADDESDDADDSDDSDDADADAGSDRDASGRSDDDEADDAAEAADEAAGEDDAGGDDAEDEADDSDADEGDDAADESEADDERTGEGADDDAIAARGPDAGKAGVEGGAEAAASSGEDTDDEEPREPGESEPIAAPAEPTKHRHAGPLALLKLDKVDDDPAFRLRDEGDIDALATSIAKLGQLFPVELRLRPPDRFQIITGFRRIAALRLLKRERVLARIHTGLSDQEALELALADLIEQRGASRDELVALETRLSEEGRLPPSLRRSLQAAIDPEANGLASETVDEPEEEVDLDELTKDVIGRLAGLNQDLAIVAELFSALDRPMKDSLLEQLGYPEQIVAYLRALR